MSGRSREGGSGAERNPKNETLSGRSQQPRRAALARLLGLPLRGGLDSMAARVVDGRWGGEAHRCELLAGARL